ncbi:MAG: SDR family NAD(P)-dependent oxidoreductase, partial [Terriglobales bacterium]
MKDTGLRNKVVIVTGAAAGIGLATARRFAGEGCRVAAWDVNDAGQGELLRELSSLGGEALFRKVNVGNFADVESAVGEIVGRWGAVDVLVNNAGITRDSQFVKWKDGAVAGTMTDDAFDSVISVNLKGV